MLVVHFQIRKHQAEGGDFAARRKRRERSVMKSVRYWPEKRIGLPSVLYTFVGVRSPFQLVSRFPQMEKAAAMLGRHGPRARDCRATTWR